MFAYGSPLKAVLHSMLHPFRVLEMVMSYLLKMLIRRVALSSGDISVLELYENNRKVNNIAVLGGVDSIKRLFGYVRKVLSMKSCC